MRRLSKMLIITMLITMVMSVAILPVVNVYAATPGEIITGIENETKNNTDLDAGGLTAMAARIISIIKIASAVAAVVLIAVFGFKFIMGSAEEKSDYMKSFIPLIVGVVVVFSATFIADLIFGVANSSTTGSTMMSSYIELA